MLRKPPHSICDMAAAHVQHDVGYFANLCSVRRDHLVAIQSRRCITSGPGPAPAPPPAMFAPEPPVRDGILGSGIVRS